MSIAERTSRIRSGLMVYRDVRLLGITCLGLASGLPAPLIFANLSIWLADEGLSRTSVAVFGMVATPYAINFLWAPVFDRIRPPITHKLGQRRGWLAILLSLLLASVIWLGQHDPASHLTMMAVAAVCTAFLSASLDVVVDAYRIEIMEANRLAAASAVGVMGWHAGGTIIGGAGGLLLASHLGWQTTYALLACVLVIPLIAVAFLREPDIPKAAQISERETWRDTLYNGIILPLKKLAEKPYWLEILAFIILFKLGDAMLGRMSGVFYREMGFDYATIAEVSKIYGVSATLIGGIAGGTALRILGMGRGLFVAGVLMSVTNLLFAGLAAHPDKFWFALAIIGDGLTSGFAVVAFVAFLSRLCDAGFAATQYALLASVGNFARIQLSSFSGWWVDHLNGNWQVFFITTACFAIPGLAILAHLLLQSRQRSRKSASSGTDQDFTVFSDTNRNI